MRQEKAFRVRDSWKHWFMYLDLLNLWFEPAQNLHTLGEKLEQSKSTVERAKPITSDTGVPTLTLRTVFANCP